MRPIGALAMEVAVKLEPKIEAVTAQDEAEITIRMKHGWIASIGIFVVELYKKLKMVD